MTDIKARPWERFNLSVLQLAAFAVGSLSVVGYVGGELLGLLRDSRLAWWQPDVLLSATVASIGVFLLAAVLRGGARARNASPGPRRWVIDRWPAWIGAVAGCGGLVLYTVLADRWAERSQLAEAGIAAATMSLNENVALDVVSPLLVMSPLLAAGVVWWVHRQRGVTGSNSRP
jgi:hypothetical protein